MSISPPITRAPAAVILFVAIALVQTLFATAAAVAIRPPSVFLAIDMPATVTPPKARLWHGRIDQAIADDGFTDLQTMYNGTGRSSGKKGGPSATKGDKKLQGSKLLFQTHERLGAVIEMLEQFAKVDVEPAGGEEYSKKEVCEILSKYKPRSGTRAAAMKAIIEHNAKYVEGCSKPTINRLMIAYGEKKFDRLTTAWSGKGRPAVLSDKDINGIVESIKGKAGEAFSSKDIEGMMNRKITEHLDQNGIVQLQEKNISPSTVSNYTAMLADQTGISIVNATTRKPNTRYASENSLRGAVALISMVGSTHFIPTKLENDDIRQELKTMPNSTRLLTDMVSIAWGCPVFPVDPRFLFSTDDTTEYTFEGVKGDEHQFVLTSTASAAKRGTSSVYTTDTSNAFKGMRVKLTFTFSGLGTCLPLVATVAGLTEHEMPDTDFKVVKIPDLCIGGGVDVDSNRHGYLILMRGGEGADLKRFRWYQEHILIPGIKAHRLKYGGFDSDSGSSHCLFTLLRSIPVEVF
ncbi:hypothetical protein THAOC_34754 [Thalassiosira oceanica]|uniref:Uncharacterized protein n=1 Tax=Thalassiosira oceanica TaxID=159749 RepID=K0R208_THAOC|nr:hypothetical protein THAOC_34754 [Thalassiosira oceanica]|eukprot:EJK46578.1 hypothetical protein THAOC_34754 [Thalassiosira oceanica]